ncbi:BnaA09g44280D [Brassica napus]|uniref:BnaA09g44280D protein n=1 Tax=Brassica napus TaxID=3708 RepID=A0A078G9H6_BRANA|nr:BnaA09g44280D [Brassica napus]
MNGGGLWPNQAQRVRTYTKVQKRGSVGRSIDVTRYSGYEELRNDLAIMFGTEGHLEDPQPSDWKLVHTDHEKVYCSLVMILGRSFETDSDNAWKVHYEDTSAAASFNR